MSSDVREELHTAMSNELRLMSSTTVLHSQAVASAAGLHSTDMETLDILNVLGPMTAGQLGEWAGLTSGATTRLIDRLEREGLAHRVADPDDRRRVIVVPNAAEGRGRLLPHFEALIAGMEELMARFSDDELRLILRFLRECSDVVRAATARLHQDSER